MENCRGLEEGAWIGGDDNYSKFERNGPILCRIQRRLTVIGREKFQLAAAKLLTA